VHDFSAKCGFFQIFKERSGADRVTGSEAPNVQNAQSSTTLEVSEAGHSEQISDQGVRRHFAYCIMAMFVLSEILKFVALFMIAHTPSLSTVLAVEGVESLVSDGLLVLVLKEMAQYYFPTLEKLAKRGK